MLRRSLLLILALSLVAGSVLAADALAPRPFSPVQNGFTDQAEKVLPYAQDRLLIQFTSGKVPANLLTISLEKGARANDALTGNAAIDALAREAGVTAIERPYHRPANAAKSGDLGVDRWFMFRMNNANDLPGLAERFRKQADVAAVSLDWRAFPAISPADPLYTDHWGHNNTAQLPDLDWGGTYSHTLSTTVGTVGFDANAEAAWDAAQGYGNSSVIIAILDSGVDADHPDLRQITGYDFGDNDTNPDDDSAAPGHGTCCAGVAAGMHNSLGSVGIAADCSIMPCKIADSNGSMYFSYIQDALYWAADNGADVISMSLGAPLSSDSATDAALAYAYNAGVTILAATGNENQSTISYPAINQYVIAVGAASPCGERKRSSSSSTEVNPDVDTDPNGYTCDGERWWGSNYGTTVQDAAGAVDILAPTILPTTDIGGSGGYQTGDYEPFFNGTSCATPYAAGVAALVVAANPGYTPAQVRDAIMSNAQDVTGVESGYGWDRYSGYGMIDAAAAVGGGGPVAPTANFAGTPTSGDFPLTVTFTDASAGAPTSWSWTFGDGGTSTAQNPSHTYTTAGTYDVSLTVSNSEGNDSVTKTNYITVTAPPAPTASFVGAPVSGSYPLNVTFTDQSAGSPTSWSWTFGDGGTATAQNPTHTYNAVGTYTVALTVSNVNGSDSVTKTNYITVTEPGVTTFVTASGETSVIGTVSGNYAATVSSDNVRETITEVLYTGHPRKQYSYLEHRWNFSLPAGGDATFHLEASRNDNSDGDNFTFEYSTDGATWLPLVTVASSTEQAYSASLGAVSGAVTVRVTDTDRNWYKTALDALSVDYMAFELGDAQPTAPTAAFAGTPTSGEYPLTVNFTDASTGDPTAWAWTFGDGGTSTTQNPQHVYAAAGVYTVVMTASNAVGSDSETKTGYITVTEPGVGGDTMHVQAMSVTRAKVGPNYQGRCTVTVQDDAGQAVSGATVYAVYDGATSGSTSGVTGSTGTVTLLASSIKKPSGEWCFEVTNMTHATLTYDESANNVTRACESGTAFGADGKLVLPASFALEQNYPNPFNPITAIQFSLPYDSSVRLVIYNVKGEVVKVLADGAMSAGTHSVQWDARSASSGVYFYRIEAPGFTETRKMTMLK